MNKKKKVIIGVLAVILVAAVGYAIFSDTLTINGTATAQGNFDLTYECALNEQSTKGGTGECSDSGNTITTTSTLSKPSDQVVYTVTITNNGTIPAVLKTVDSSNNMNEGGTSTGDYAYFDTSTGLVGVYNIEGNYGDSAIEAANFVIQPEEKMTVTITHGWADLGSSQPTIPDDGASINYNVTFGFEQANS